MLEEMGVVFAANFLAELGDKTQLAVLALSARNKDHNAVLLGSVGGLCLATLLAIVAGAFISKLFDASLLKTASGVIFIAFGAYSLLSKEEDDGKVGDGSNPLVSSFVLLFLMELGDKTQLANLLFASAFEPLPAFIGAAAALAILSAIAVYFGKGVAGRFGHKTIRAASSIAFILIGIAMAALAHWLVPA